jgi:hypothetical protein
MVKTLAERGSVTPDALAPTDWMAYLMEAIRREHGTWDPSQDRGREWRAEAAKSVRVASQLVEPFVLALALDWAATKRLELSRRPAHEVLSADSLTRPLWRRSGSIFFWRHVWFSRFTTTQHEKEFYGRWLTTLEVVEDMPLGSPDRETLLQLARERLSEAEAEIRWAIKAGARQATTADSALETLKALLAESE